MKTSGGCRVPSDTAIFAILYGANGFNGGHASGRHGHCSSYYGMRFRAIFLLTHVARELR